MCLTHEHSNKNDVCICSKFVWSVHCSRSNSDRKRTAKSCASCVACVPVSRTQCPWSQCPGIWWSDVMCQSQSRYIRSHRRHSNQYNVTCHVEPRMTSSRRGMVRLMWVRAEGQSLSHHNLWHCLVFPCLWLGVRYLSPNRLTTL